MSTHATINVKSGNKVTQIYVHSDGGTLMEILTKNYNCQELADMLVSFGDASAIRNTFSECEFYIRDRGEWECVGKEFPNIDKALDYRHFTYNYYWNGDLWATE